MIRKSGDLPVFDSKQLGRCLRPRVTGGTTPLTHSLNMNFSRSLLRYAKAFVFSSSYFFS